MGVRCLYSLVALALSTLSFGQTYGPSEVINHASWLNHRYEGGYDAYGDGNRIVVRRDSDGAILYDAPKPEGLIGNGVSFGGDSFVTASGEIRNLATGALVKQMVFIGHPLAAAPKSTNGYFALAYNDKGIVSFKLVPLSDGGTSVSTRVYVKPEQFDHIELTEDHVVVPGPQVYDLTGKLLWRASRPGDFDVSPNGQYVANLYGRRLSVYSVADGSLVWSRSVNPTLESGVEFVGNSAVAILRDDANEMYRLQLYGTSDGVPRSRYEVSVGYPQLVDANPDGSVYLGAATEPWGFFPEPPLLIGLNTETGEGEGSRLLGVNEDLATSVTAGHYTISGRIPVTKPAMVATDEITGKIRILTLEASEASSTYKSFVVSGALTACLSPDGKALLAFDDKSMKAIRLSDGASWVWDNSNSDFKPGKDWTVQGNKLVEQSSGQGNGYNLASANYKPTLDVKVNALAGYAHAGTVRLEIKKTDAGQDGSFPPIKLYRFDLVTYKDGSTTPVANRVLIAKAYSSPTFKRNDFGYINFFVGGNVGQGYQLLRTTSTGAIQTVSAAVADGYPSYNGKTVFSEKFMAIYPQYAVMPYARTLESEDSQFGGVVLAEDGRTVIHYYANATAWDRIWSGLHITRF